MCMMSHHGSQVQLLIAASSICHKKGATVYTYTGQLGGSAAHMQAGMWAHMQTSTATRRWTAWGRVCTIDACDLILQELEGGLGVGALIG